MLKVNILTPENVVYSGEANSVILPGYDGLLGVLPNHAELVNELTEGVVTLNGTEESTFNIKGGLARVNNNVLTILADSLVE